MRNLSHESKRLVQQCRSTQDNYYNLIYKCKQLNDPVFKTVTNIIKKQISYNHIPFRSKKTLFNQENQRNISKSPMNGYGKIYKSKYNYIDPNHQQPQKLKRQYATDKPNIVKNQRAKYFFTEIDNKSIDRYRNKSPLQYRDFHYKQQPLVQSNNIRNKSPIYRRNYQIAYESTQFKHDQINKSPIDRGFKYQQLTQNTSKKEKAHETDNKQDILGQKKRIKELNKRLDSYIQNYINQQ